MVLLVPIDWLLIAHWLHLSGSSWANLRSWQGKEGHLPPWTRFKALLALVGIGWHWYLHWLALVGIGIFSPSVKRLGRSGSTKRPAADANEGERAEKSESFSQPGEDRPNALVLNGFVHKFFYPSNLIFWIVMGCDIGQKPLNFGLEFCSQRPQMSGQWNQNEQYDAHHYSLSNMRFEQPYS